MLKAFNLLDEPWLPVRYADGRIAEWGVGVDLTMTKEEKKGEKTQKNIGL